MGKASQRRASDEDELSIQEEIKERIASLRTFLWKNILISVCSVMSLIWLTDAWVVYYFEHNVKDANITSYGEALWWGIVTFLTVGYGDRYPITTEGREAASILMVSGVACVGIITAKISSIFLEQALRDGRGVVNTAKLKNHFIICGWNEDMYELLTHILDFNSNLTSADIVLVANASQPQIEALRAMPNLEDLHVVQGDHFNEVNLKRAAPERARKILILADRLPGAGGQAATPTEIDARTIMAAMTLSNIARGTLVTAEILDPKMDHYLKLASVTEIIYSSEYSRLLLGNATSGTGIANIIFDLLDSKAGAHITSVPLPEALHGGTYDAVKKHLERQNPAWLVIGLLENSGNSHSIRERALKRAQQTPDMAQLVANLMSVREIRCNAPIFHPPADRKVTESTMAIVIAKREAQKETAKGGSDDSSEKARSLAA
jgi:voltage-gated potassium channel